MITGPASGFTPRPYQEWALEGGAPHLGMGIMPAFARYRKVLAVMATGCHAKGQPIMMADGSTRLVENIEIGDLLMGPDLTREDGALAGAWPAGMASSARDRTCGFTGARMMRRRVIRGGSTWTTCSR